METKNRVRATGDVHPLGGKKHNSKENNMNFTGFVISQKIAFSTNCRVSQTK